MKLLHITTHMGGGVGHAISDLVVNDKRNEHEIYLLQQPEKTHYIKKCKDDKINVYGRETSIKELLQSADIIILHWWHHPLMYKFIYDFPKIEIRLVLWSHVSGCTYPFLSYDFINKFDKVLITSRYSLENNYWQEKKDSILPKMKLVYGMGELKKLEKKDYYKNNGHIKVGYIGTLSKSKLHPDFVISCKKILECFPDIEFYIIGDKNGGEWINQEAVELGIEEKIHLVGFVEDINEWLLKLDIFGYPLNPDHYGTTENSILEAMTVGLPIVLLKQATEKYIVQHLEDGILAENMEDYVEQIIKLATNTDLREKLGIKASENVSNNFSFRDNLNNFLQVMEQIEEEEKKMVSFQDVLGKEPYEWFLNGINPEDKKRFTENKDIEKLKELLKKKYIFFEKTKSSIIHFANTYYEDKQLQLWKDELEL